MSYTTIDHDGDNFADDYALRLSVHGVNTPHKGGQVLVTPAGTYRYSGSTVASCTN